MLYPLKMKPFFRHGDQTPWGGRALREIFGKPAPDDRTGESLEVSALTGMQSVVENGAFAGAEFGQVLAAWGERLTGLDPTPFPLLVKLLDAREMLSVQVHPGNEYAREHENKLGKTEAWVILSAPRGSQLVYGVKAEEPLGQMVVDGRLEEALNWIEVAPGDVLYIPHGLVHALGHGIVVYEIQQSSDVTYRFWDWGRTDKEGNPRALHTRQALDVTRPDLRPAKLEGATVLAEGGSVTFYVSDGNFELSRLNVAGDMPLPKGRMLLLTALGECVVRWPQGKMQLRAGETCVVPAALAGDCVLSGQLNVLCSSTCDQGAVRQSLGYRAEAVAGLEG